MARAFGGSLTGWPNGGAWSTIRPRMPPAEHRRLIAVALVYSGLLVALEWLVRPAGVVGGEADGYADRGVQLLRGQLGGDRFHPFLYPELIAVGFAIVGDAVATARAISCAFAGLLLYSSYRLVRELLGVRPALWTLALLAVDPEVVLLGIRAAADMTATALFATGLWLAAGAKDRAGRMVWAGACLGLATAARLSFTGVVPMVAIAAIVLNGSARPARAALAIGAGAVLGYLPNAVPSLLAFGTPMPGDSWRNLAFKLSGDPESLVEPQYPDCLAMLAADGVRLVELGVRDFVAMWNGMIGKSLAGEAAPRPLVLALTWLVWIACGCAVFTWPWRRTFAVLAVLGGYTALHALTFFPQVRLLVPIAPLVLMAITGLAFAAGRRWPRVAHTACAALAVAVATSLAPALRSLAASYPLAEIAAAREVVRREGPLVTIASFYGPMGDQLTGRTIYVPHVPRGERGAAAVYRRLSERLQSSPADYLVIGPKSCDAASTEELRASAPPGFVVEHCDEAVLVLRLPRARADWLQRAAASLGPDRTLELAIETSAGVDLFAAGFTVSPPDGAAYLLPLAAVGDGVFRATVPLAAGSTGAWTLVPTCVLLSGEVHKGEPITLTLP